MSRRVPLALLTAALAVGVAGCSSQDVARTGAVAVVSRDGDSSWSGVQLDTPYPRPATELADTAGRPFSLARDATGPITLVFFGYTNCREICGTVLADIATTLRRSDDQLRSETRVVFITTDPARDTGPVLREYLDRFDPSFVGLTGPLPRIEEAAQVLGIALTGTTALPGGGYDVGHSSQLIGFGPDGRGRVVWTLEQLTVPGLRADLQRLASSA